MKARRRLKRLRHKPQTYEGVYEEFARLPRRRLRPTGLTLTIVPPNQLEQALVVLARTEGPAVIYGIRVRFQGEVAPPAADGGQPLGEHRHGNMHKLTWRRAARVYFGLEELPQDLEPELCSCASATPGASVAEGQLPDP